MKYYRFLNAVPDETLFERARVEANVFGHLRVRPFVEDLARRGEVTFAEYAVPLNSYEREVLLPALTNDLFIEVTEYSLRNCAEPLHGRPTVTYDESVIDRYAPEALRRLKAAQEENARLKRELRQLRDERESDEVER